LEIAGDWPTPTTQKAVRHWLSPAPLGWSVEFLSIVSRTVRFSVSCWGVGGLRAEQPERPLLEAKSLAHSLIRCWRLRRSSTPMSTPSLPGLRAGDLLQAITRCRGATRRAVAWKSETEPDADDGASEGANKVGHPASASLGIRAAQLIGGLTDGCFIRAEPCCDRGLFEDDSTVFAELERRAREAMEFWKEIARSTNRQAHKLSSGYVDEPGDYRKSIRMRM